MPAAENNAATVTYAPATYVTAPQESYMYAAAQRSPPQEPVTMPVPEVAPTTAFTTAYAPPTYVTPANAAMQETFPVHPASGPVATMPVMTGMLGGTPGVPSEPVVGGAQYVQTQAPYVASMPVATTQLGGQQVFTTPLPHGTLGAPVPVPMGTFPTGVAGFQGTIPAGQGGTLKAGSITDDVFNMVDRNNDGVISRSEFRGALKGNVISATSRTRTVIGR